MFCLLTEENKLFKLRCCVLMVRLLLIYIYTIFYHFSSPSHFCCWVFRVWHWRLGRYYCYSGSKNDGKRWKQHFWRSSNI